MKTQLLKITFLAIFGLSSLVALSKGTLRGTVVDADTNETLIGASIVLEGTTRGTVTDFDGTFKIEVDAGETQLVISYLGFLDKKMAVSVVDGQTKDLGTIALDPDAVGINEVMVLASVGIQRKTPVAISTIDAELVTEKIGTQEFPEILQTTPGVYATKEGGGWGDGRFNLRGFDSPNVAVMINGIPVNDMEWGGIYWSNWMGMTDVLRSMQVQRGLGASKVAAPSVGGSVNIVTKTTDAEEGGSFSTAYGNDGYRKVLFSVSSGLTESGWAFSLLGSKTWGDGYIQGTEFEGYSYFFNLSKRFNDKHTLSFTGFGAPQWHNQRSSFDKYTIREWQQFKEEYRFNATYGFGIDGQRVVAAKNYYHKPQFSLNHFWTINNISSLSTSLYYSIGEGGGRTQRGNERSRLYGSNDDDRTINGYLDYAAIQRDNAANMEGSQAILGSSNNGHQWMGAISTYTAELTPDIDFYGGVDLRYYIGKHNRTITDLLGGEFFIDPDRENVAYQDGNEDYLYEKLSTGDKISRDYDGHVLWEGLFGQLEYNYNDWSVFYSGAISNTTYWRYDNMYYAPGEEKSDNISFLGWSSKGGANYNIDAKNNVFTNIGYFSRAPFYSNVFLADDVSNEINDGAKNEKVFSAELGYGYKSRILSANLNVYYTEWQDKSLAGALDSRDPDAGRYNAEGVNAIHKGVELEAKAKITKDLTLKGMLSIGDWKWDKDVEAYVFNRDGQLVNSDGDIVNTVDEADKIELNIGGVHVGDAAQTNAYLGLDYKIIKDLKIGVDYKYNARLYADPGSIRDLEGEDTWKVPGAGTVDANALYYFTIGGLNASIRGNVHNLLDKEYISDADSGSSGTWEDALVFYGFGRTGSVSLKINF
ncbi:TonB-dependent receptor [Sunxiuqinia indica]|uniref:TonB-dependent receptor n=1 Tax=Sunxiuqinia indica TaxID=2692584 RepID=UPI001357A50F|nr:TonB-dependent receptor [Sunxiuqinia indica]